MVHRCGAQRHGPADDGGKDRRDEEEVGGVGEQGTLNLCILLFLLGNDQLACAVYGPRALTTPAFAL